jgi:hypothetical protein
MNQPASVQIHFLKNSSLFVKMLGTKQKDLGRTHNANFPSPASVYTAKRLLHELKLI